MDAALSTPVRHRAPVLAAAVLGLALSGFFDGILLHQVLQWHHLLSLVPGETWRDMRNQILADGLFHVLMYLVASAGLLLLWKARRHLAEPGAGRRLAGGAMLGFGLWNVIDVVGFHWLAGIHRIRVGVPNPLAYDLGWLALFAVPFLIAGVMLLRTGSGGRGGRAVGGMLALFVLAGGSIAASPPREADTVVALFQPGSAGFIAAAAVDAPVIWVDARSGLIALKIESTGQAADLYRQGALLVTRSAAVAGCLAWTRAK